MGTYIYKVTRSKSIATLTPAGDAGPIIHLASYAYKPYFSGWDADKANMRMHNRYVAPSTRAWRKHGDAPKLVVQTHMDEPLSKQQQHVVYDIEGAASYHDSNTCDKLAGFITKRTQRQTGQIFWIFMPTTDWKEVPKDVY